MMHVAPAPARRSTSCSCYSSSRPRDQRPPSSGCSSCGGDVRRLRRRRQRCGESDGSAASSRAEDSVGTRASALDSATRSGCVVGDGTAAPFDDAIVTEGASALGDVGARASAGAPASRSTGASVFGSGRSINVRATEAPMSSFAVTLLCRDHIVTVPCVLPGMPYIAVRALGKSHVAAAPTATVRWSQRSGASGAATAKRGAPTAAGEI